MRLSDFLFEIGHPVAYYPTLTPITGGVTATLLLCQLHYWRDKCADPEGWIYKTRLEIQHETGLSRHEQGTARSQLRLRGLIEEKFGNMPRKRYYRINVEALDAVWNQHKAGIRSTAEPQQTSHKAGKRPYVDTSSIKPESGQQESRKAASKRAGKRPAIFNVVTEITTETTPKILPPVSSDEETSPRWGQTWNARKRFPQDFPQEPPTWFLVWAAEAVPTVDVRDQWPDMLDTTYRSPRTKFYVAAKRWMQNAAMYQEQRNGRPSKGQKPTAEQLTAQVIARQQAKAAEEHAHAGS